jgi:serine/threonine protein kinase
MFQSKQTLAQRLWMSPYNQEYTAYWIRYKPERLGRQRLGRSKMAIVTVLAITLATTATILLLGFNHVLSGFLLILLGGIMISSAFAALAMIDVFAPTHIELNEKGLRFHWLKLLFRASTPLITWDRISHVTTVTRNVLNKEEITLEFNAIARGIGIKKRFPYFLLAPRLTWGWFSSDRAQIRFEIDAIASSDDRKRLQLALKKFLPSYRIEPKVADDLNMYLKFDSYTDLWLDKLQEDSNRTRESRLESDTVLANGTYQIVQPIGSGGQALVYLASMLKPLPAAESKNAETAIDMSDLPFASAGTSSNSAAPPLVVLKEFVLPTQAGTNIRKRVLENIQKEATLWRKLRHPNIARLIDFFVEDQRAYLVLEHVDGSTLKDLVTKQGPMSEADLIKLSIKLCDILGYMHRRQPPVIHRDFTPDNIIMGSSGVVKLIDFNVAQQLEAQTTKTVVGKHSYIPPEQFRGKAVPQSDIYALGATLSYLLTGADPEPITQAHPKAERPELSEEVDSIIAKCMALGLSTRYQNCQELKTDLLALIGEHSNEAI